MILLFTFATIQAMKTYTYRIIIEPDGKYFHAYVPALSGCHTFGKTFAEAKEHVREAIAVYLEGLAKLGESIPLDDGMELFQTVSFEKDKVTI